MLRMVAFALFTILLHSQRASSSQNDRQPSRKSQWPAGCATCRYLHIMIREGKAMKPYFARSADRSHNRRGQQALHRGFHVGIVGIFLTILITTRLMTHQSEGYLLEQAKSAFQPQKIILRLSSDGKKHTVLKFSNRNSELDMGNVQGSVLNWTVNSRGDVAFSVQETDQICSYLIANGKQTAIRVPGASAVRVKKINGRGDVVGMIARHDRQKNQFVWRAFVLRQGRLIELDILGGSNCFANDINNEGLVVGKADTEEGYYHAFLWQEGQPMRDLGTLPRGQNSEAMSINDRGEIVGNGDLGENSRQALLWRDGTILHLNRQTFLRNGWDLQDGCEINEAGEITVLGVKESMLSYFLLKPRSSLLSGVSMQ